MNKQYRLLVVDDEQDILSLLETLLKKEGYDVETATSGEEALAKMEVNIPDLVITRFISGWHEWDAAHGEYT